MEALFKEMPPKKFLWNGIKEKTFAIVYGPSKSGKTILCENLAMSIACGSNEFLNYPLDGVVKRVLIVSLEENWDDRTERNLKQKESFSVQEQELIGKNYLSAPIDYTRVINRDHQWQDLRDMIKDSGSEVVIVDSITRLNHGKLEESATAEKILQNLRAICTDCSVTLIAIHHTPKLHGNPITMDSIKGSSTFAQEADTAIAVNRTDKGYRYLKNIFSRYAPCDDELVKELEMGPDTVLEVTGQTSESDILKRQDRRRADEKREKIISYFNENPSMTYTTSEIVDHFTTTLSIKGRQVQTYLSDAVRMGKVASPKKGKYTSVNRSSDGM